MNHLSLYEITHYYRNALEAFTDPEAEIPLEAALDTLEGIEGQLQEKAVNVAKFVNACRGGPVHEQRFDGGTGVPAPHPIRVEREAANHAARPRRQVVLVLLAVNLHVRPAPQLAGG